MCGIDYLHRLTVARKVEHGELKLLASMIFICGGNSAVLRTQIF